MSDPASGQGSAEAARWVEDALVSAREWFPDLSEHELREPLEQAFELASATGRGEREFHAVFEAELRRAIEERDVIGSTGSVLPGQSGSAPQPFQAVAADFDEVPEPAPGGEDLVEGEPEGDEPEEDERGHDRARAFGLAVGALRFLDGLSPKEIRDEHGIEADYYSEMMRWLLHEVDRTLDGDYPPHLDRLRMAGFAAGLEDIHASIDVDLHVRECAGCATYLADLLDGAVRMVESASMDPVVHDPVTRRRRRRRAAVMSVKAAELRKYAQRATPSAPDAAAEYPEDPPSRRAQLPRPDRRTGVRIVAAVALVVVGVAVAVLMGRGDESAPGPPVASQQARDEAAAHRADRERASRESKRAEKRAAERRREARERRAAAGRRAAQQQQQRSTPDAPAPANPPQSSPPPATPSRPVTPAPSSPSPSQRSAPPAGEFGLEP